MKQLSAVLLISCAMFAQTTPPAPQKKAAPAPPPAAPAAPARDPGVYATFNTSMGTIVAVLYEKEAPGTVANFIALARGTKPWKDPNTKQMVAKKLYDGVTFHRVIPDFMIQAGDPTGRGDHECGFTIKDEIVPTLKFDRPGRLAMANVGSPNTGACQFFIMEKANPDYDAGGRAGGAYPIFGQVIEGQDVVAKIARVPRDRNDKPNVPVKIVSVVITRVPAPGAAKTATPGGLPKKAPAPTTPPAPVKK
jgi:peptidyl-prolyl cis-trans isomerase A (cyclophilin A)